ncbi:MAG TPA: aminotransferase class I/II-fold pyridoxal phosphate-dependent enzyme [Micromonosporaceae bacterium]
MVARYQIAGRGAAEIGASVEAGVRSGELAPGAALPPVRQLAARLGVASATVAAAYRGLRERGVVETAGRNGTRVRPAPPVAARAARWVPAAPGMLDLSTGEPDARLLPSLGPALRRVAAGAGTPLGYAGAGAWPRLVELARERFAADGVRVPESGVTVTSGALDAVERLLSSRLRPGDRVGIEDPAWARLIDLLAALGLHPVPIPVDDDGPSVDGLRHALGSGVSAVVVTSRAHNPTGGVISADRAARLRRVLADADDVLVIEDDHAGDLAEQPLSTVAHPGRPWALVRSLSKPYGPDLRVALLAGDEASIARVQGRMRLGSGWVSTVLQRLVVELWDDERVAATVARARTEYARRRTALVDALAGRGIEAHGRSGINVWVWTPDESGAVAALRDLGYAVAPGSLFRLGAAPGFRISISALGLSHVDKLADAVALAIRAPAAARARAAPAPVTV